MQRSSLSSSSSNSSPSSESDGETNAIEKVAALADEALGDPAPSPFLAVKNKQRTGKYHWAESETSGTRCGKALNDNYVILSHMPAHPHPKCESCFRWVGLDRK